MERKERLTPRPEPLVKPAAPEAEVPAEIESWLKRIEKDSQLSQSVTDANGQVLVAPAQPPVDKIILPLDRTTFVRGLKAKVGEAIRWLSEWCFRLIKMNPRRVQFKLSLGETK